MPEGEAMPENSGNTENAIEYACAFCRTGSESKIAGEIEKKFPSIDALCTFKLRKRYVKGKTIEEKVALFPGYIFLRFSNESVLYSLIKSGLIYTVLSGADGDWRVTGPDRDFVRGLFDSDGVLGFSKAYYKNDRIHVTEGPLKNYNGKILRVNHRKRTAEVQISFHGKILDVWLGFEIIENV